MTYLPMNDLWFLDGDSEFWPSFHAGRYKYSSRAMDGRLKGDRTYSEEADFLVAAKLFTPWVSIDQPGLPFNAPSVASWPGGRAGHAMWSDSAGQLFVFGGIGAVGMSSRKEEASVNPDAFNLDERLPGYCQNSPELWRFGNSSLSSGGATQVTAGGLSGMEWTKMRVLLEGSIGGERHLYTELFGSGPALQGGYYSNVAPCATLVVPGCGSHDVDESDTDSDRVNKIVPDLVPAGSRQASWTPGAGAAVWSQGNTAWGIGGARLHGSVSAVTAPGSWDPIATRGESSSTLISSLWSLEPQARFLPPSSKVVDASRAANEDDNDVLRVMEDTMVLRIESQQEKAMSSTDRPPVPKLLRLNSSQSNETRAPDSPPARFGSSVWMPAVGTVAVLGGQCDTERALGWGWYQSTELVAAGIDCQMASDWMGPGTSLEDCASACASHTYFTLVDGPGGDNNCKCCTSSPDMGDLAAARSYNVYRNGNAPIPARPEIAMAGMECTVGGGWIGPGTDVETCALSCGGYDFFSRFDNGDGDCKCCTAPLRNSTLSLSQQSNVYRTQYGTGAGTTGGMWKGRATPRCQSNDMWVRSRAHLGATSGHQ